MNIFLRIICVFAFGLSVHSRASKTINLALETAVLFEPEDTSKHLMFIREARRFLDTLEEALMPKILRTNEPKKTLTGFLNTLADIILHLYEEDLKTFFKVLENEMKNQFMKGSIFRDIVYDPKLQTFIRNKLKEWANTNPRQMKAKLRQYMAKGINHNDTLHDLGRFLNDYYGREQELKMDEIIERFSKTSDEAEISIIVRDALNTLVLQHYDKMNYTTRAKLVDKINKIKHEYFTSHVDHDLKLTFRGAQSKETDSTELMDAWLLKIEKGEGDKDIDISDLEVSEMAKDKEAPVLTIEDWDGWLNEKNKKGFRKTNTLISGDIEKIIKASDEFKLKKTLKDNSVKVSATYDEREKATSDIKLRNNENDESIDKPEKVTPAEDLNLRQSEIDISLSDYEKDRTIADNKLRNNESDESADGSNKGESTADKALRRTEIDVSFVKSGNDKTTANYRSGYNEHDESIDESNKIQPAAEINLYFDEPEKERITSDFILQNEENDTTIDEPKSVNAIDSKLEHPNKIYDGKLETIKASGDFKLVNNQSDESADKTKKVKVYTIDFKFGNNQKSFTNEPEKDKATGHPKLRKYNVMEDESETTNNDNKLDLTTVKVFNRLDGKKPNKELIVDKDLEIYVGGFDATLE